jgi:hypothetical protein
MRPRYFLIVAILSVAMASASDVKGYEFHGLKLGTSEKALAANFPEFKCEDDKADLSLRRCQAPFALTKRPGVMHDGKTNVSLAYHNDVLININVIWFSSMFDQTLLSFKKYYGDPLGMQPGRVETKGGKVLNNARYIWSSGNESIVYEKYFSDERISRIVFLSIDNIAKPEITSSEPSAAMNNVTVQSQSGSPASTAKKVKSAKHYDDIFSGKTAAGNHLIRNYVFKDYFNKDGTIIEIRDDGVRKEGVWSIKKVDILCIIWQNNTDCGRLAENSDGSVSFSRNKIEKRRFNLFEEGNTLE